nr:LppP/LprE family lipoprotein [Leucobacter ruminantium]
MANDTKVTYLFIGDIWVLIFDYAGQREYAQAALDGILAANPSLAGKGEGSAASGSPKCSGLSGNEALGKWGAGISGGPWDLTGQFSDVKGYDECAALSWIVLRPEPCCTRFSITPVLFFHNGEYVSSATSTGHAVDSEKGVQRLSDEELSVTYMWQGDDIAGPANTATSTYRWDEASGTVTRTGELPPS